VLRDVSITVDDEQVRIALAHTHAHTHTCAHAHTHARTHTYTGAHSLLCAHCTGALLQKFIEAGQYLDMVDDKAAIAAMPRDAWVRGGGAAHARGPWVS